MGTKGNGISVNQPAPWSAPAERSGDGAFPRIPDYAKSESPTTSRASHPPVVHRKSLNHKGSRAQSCLVMLSRRGGEWHDRAIATTRVDVLDRSGRIQL